MTNHDEYDDHSPGPFEPPGADGDIDVSHVPDDRQGSVDQGPPPAEQKPAGDAPRQADAPKKPGVDVFVDNTTSLLRRGSDLLPYVWIAIVIVAMLPTMWKLAHGYDPLDPFSFDYGVSIFVVEVICQLGALTLLAASFPAGRACLLSDDDHVRTLDGGTDVMFRHLLDAIPLAVIYYIAVMGGLMLCIAPGLFAAVFLLPALYLGTAGEDSPFRAILKAPGHVTEHSTLYAILVVGYMATMVVLSLGAGLVLGAAAPDGDIGAAITDPLFVVGFSIGFIAVTALLYLFYVALISLFVTTE